MEQLALLLIPVPLIIFWFWMLWDLTNNDRLSSDPSAPLTWPPSNKFGWTLVLVFMNVFGACFYYFYEYRNRY